MHGHGRRAVSLPLQILVHGLGQKGLEISIAQSKKLSMRLAEFSRLLESDETLDLNRLTLGDCGFPISFAWIDAFTRPMGLQVEWSATVNNYRSQIELHAAVAEELLAYRPGIAGWMQSRGV